MAKDKRFLPVEKHTPVEEEFYDFKTMDEEDDDLPNQKELYVAS